MVIPALKPEVLLSENSRKACIERLKSLQLPVSKLSGDNVKEAAVLVPLCMHKGELGLLYTLRSMNLTVSRGQVSFPGGKRDEGDVDLIETAIRETWEELKIPKEKIDVWSTVTFIPNNNLNVMPVLGYIGEVVPEEMDINRNEVEEVFVISLRQLYDPDQWRYTHFHINNLTLPTFLGGKYRVWGFTGAITKIVLNALVPQNYFIYNPRQVQRLRTNVATNKIKKSADRDYIKTTWSKL